MFPWSSFVPDLVTVSITPPRDRPYLAEYVLEWTTNSAMESSPRAKVDWYGDVEMPPISPVSTPVASVPSTMKFMPCCGGAPLITNDWREDAVSLRTPVSRLTRFRKFLPFIGRFVTCTGLNNPPDSALLVLTRSTWATTDIASCAVATGRATFSRVVVPTDIGTPVLCTVAKPAVLTVTSETPTARAGEV